MRVFNNHVNIKTTIIFLFSVKISLDYAYVLFRFDLMYSGLYTSVASFLVWGGGGGQDPQMYRQKKVTYVRERAPQKHIFSVLQIHLHAHNAVPFYYLWHSAV